MPKRDDIAVSDSVLLPLETKLAVVPAGGQRAAPEEEIPRSHFGADEAALNVRMNGARGFLRRRVARDRPCPAFILTHREERDVAEQMVGGADDAVQP